MIDFEEDTTAPATTQAIAFEPDAEPVAGEGNLIGYEGDTRPAPKLGGELMAIRDTGNTRPESVIGARLMGFMDTLEQPSFTIPKIGKVESPLGQAGAAVVDSVTGVIDSLSSAKGLAATAALAGGGLAAELAQGAFAAEGFKDLPDAIARTANADNAYDAVSGGIGALFDVGMVAGGTRPARPPGYQRVTEDIGARLMGNEPASTTAEVPTQATEAVNFEPDPVTQVPFKESPAQAFSPLTEELVTLLRGEDLVEPPIPVQSAESLALDGPIDYSQRGRWFARDISGPAGYDKKGRILKVTLPRAEAELYRIGEDGFLLPKEIAERVRQEAIAATKPASTEPLPPESRSAPAPQEPALEAPSQGSTEAQTAVAETLRENSTATLKESPTGLRNAIVDQERAKRGLPERMQPLQRTFGQAWDEAMARVDKDATAGAKLVAEVAKDPRALTDTDAALLAHEQVTRQNAFDQAVEAVNAKPGDAVAAEALRVARDDVQAVYDAGQLAGTESGRSLAARKMLVADDYSLAKMEATTRAIANEGKPLTTEQLAEVKTLHERIAATEAKLAEYEAKQAAREADDILKTTKAEARKAARLGETYTGFLDTQIERARLRLRKRSGALNLGINPADLADHVIIAASYIAKGAVTIADFTERVVKDFGEAIRDTIPELFEKARAYHAENAGLFKTKRTPEEIRLAASKKAIAIRTEKLKAKTAAGDFSKPVKKEPLMDREKADLIIAYEKAKADYDKLLTDAERAKRTGSQKVKDATLDVLQSARGIILGSDIGVLTRQGLFAWSRPVGAIKATSQAFQSAISPAAMSRWEVQMRNVEIDGKQAAPQRKAAGLRVTDTLKQPEELVVSKLLSRIPDFKVAGKTVKLSEVGKTLERFQTTFINSARIYAFDSALRRGYSPEELKLRANFINSATGSGNIRHVPKALSAIMTSPRYEASRWEMIAQPVRNLGRLAIDGKRGDLNRAALDNLQDLAVTAAGVYGLFKLAEVASGYTVNWNPTSSDFLKMRKGDDVWDVTAGLAPRIRDVVRVFVAITHPSYKNNLGKVVLGAGLRAVNPVPKTLIDQGGVAYQRATGAKNPNLPFSGFRSDEEREGLIALAPLIAQSLKESLDEDSGGQTAFTGAREFVGFSVNRYPKPKDDE